MGSAVALSPEVRQAVAALVASVAEFAAALGVDPELAVPAVLVPVNSSGSASQPAARKSDDGGSPPGADADPLRELAGVCLDSLAEVGRLEARLAGLKVRLAAEFVAADASLTAPGAGVRECTVREMSAAAEVACALTVSERSAGALVSQAMELTARLPLTLAALEAGQVSWQHARVVVDEAAGLESAGAARLEAHFLAPYFPDLAVTDPARGCLAGELVPGRFRAKVRAWRERHHRESIEVRHVRGVGDRRVEFLPDRDGMAWLNAYLPADTAAGIWERSTAAARSLQGPGEDRTLSQLRADVAATWLLTGNGAATNVPTRRGSGAVAGLGAGTGTDIGEVPGWLGGVPSPRAQVLVTVPVLSLLGVTEEPAVLDGFGPIPPSMARRLVAEGADSFYRVLVDPRDGAPLEIGRSSYRLTKPLRQWLRLRDGKCPFPGCNNASLDNDADHLLAWAEGGTTGISNLGQPCRKHHRLKHATAWTPTAASKTSPPGWTSPTGRAYPSEHQDWEPPHWPKHVPASESPAGDPPRHSRLPDLIWPCTRRSFPESMRHCA